ncbi:MAG: RNA 2',3'-cyclic phosphodiesterase [Nitrospiraceae bacterium]|nr:RNA 2',3'-cyclic phosphodiesterase [Nitrospiraceae bacterium]
MSDIRCFVSIEIPEDVKAVIEAETARLRRSGADVKWVAAKNLHFTIKFLGDVPEEKLPELALLLAGSVRDTGPFEMELYGTGVFPGERSPRVVWIGVRDTVKMDDVRLNVENTLEKAGGSPRERKPFVPHLTLGRVKSLRGRPGLLEGLATLKDILFGKIMVENIYLMRSELKPGGPEYSVLKKIPFGAGL